MPNILQLCYADWNRIPPILYGLRSLNGLPQRGPNSYDCIGWVRHILLIAAPKYAFDSWTCIAYLESWTSCGLPITNRPAHAGDILLWLNSSSIPRHIGISDGRGNVFSCLNPIQNLCLVPTNQISWPTMVVLPTGLEDIMVPFNSTITLLRSDMKPSISLNDVDPRIRFVGELGERIAPPSPFIDVFAYDPSGCLGFAEPVYKTVVNGKIVSILARNAYAQLPK